MKRRPAPAWTDDQRECIRLLCDWLGGEHHLPRHMEPCGFGVVCVVSGALASFDTDRLTRLILLAHDRCVRVEIGGAANQYLRVALWRRHSRSGGGGERHPTIEQAVELHRRYFPGPADGGGE